MFAFFKRWLAAAVLSTTLSLPGELLAQSGDAPQYGGTIEIATIFGSLSALSWDHKDWPWKINHDAGSIYEQLLVADMSKAKRNGGPHTFKVDAWVPTDAVKGELAESWEVRDNPLAVVFKLKKGIMFPAKPGVMEARELTADDVVFSHYYRHNSHADPLAITTRSPRLLCSTAIRLPSTTAITWPTGRTASAMATTLR